MLKIEGNDLIDKLLLFPNSPQFPVEQFGLRASEDARRLVDTFPDILTDPLDAQAALAFLLIKNRVSVTVTLGPSFDVALREGATLDPLLDKVGASVVQLTMGDVGCDPGVGLFGQQLDLLGKPLL